MKPWEYEPSEYINRSISETLTVFPREKDIAYSLLRVLGTTFFRIFFKIYFRLTINGKENLPKERNYVLAANHASHLDAVCLFAILPLRKLNNVFSVAAKDYFFSSFFRSLFAVIFVNALPFDRKKGPRESLELCADILNVSDQILIMFPEGARSTTGQIQTFKPGIGKLVAGTERLVVPIYISGAYQAWAKGSVIPKPKKVTITIGQPLEFSGFEKNKESYVNIAKQIETSVLKLKKEEDPYMSKKVKYSLARFFMKTVGRMSDGIRLCYQEGLTSGKMVDYIYKNKPSGKYIIGKIIDRKFLNDPGWEAVRTRRKNLEELVIDAIETLRKKNKTISILDIASGPGAYILSVLEKVGKGDVFARCRDFESRWVEEGNLEAQIRELDNIRFELGDAFAREEILRLTPKPNLVVASGFYDWFNEDGQVKESMKIVFDALESGGYFVLSNQCAHPKLEFTEQIFVDFNKKPLRMTMRSKELIGLFLKEIGFEQEEILTDKNGYYIVIKTKKP